MKLVGVLVKYFRMQALEEKKNLIVKLNLEIGNRI